MKNRIAPFLISVLLLHCGAPPVGTDASTTDTQPIETDTSTRDSSAICATDTDCTDGVFCNGAERCSPGTFGGGRPGMPCIPRPAVFVRRRMPRVGEALCNGLRAR